MKDAKFKVNSLANGLQIEGESFTELEGLDFAAKAFDKTHILLLPQDVADSMSKTSSSSMSLESDLLLVFLTKLVDSEWSGIVHVDTGYGVKKIYFSEGSIRFATSDVIDDRLGEVIYRNDLITLDQHVNCAVKVNKTVKFGQVLLKNKYFTNLELWEALKSQVKEIINSIFFVEKVYVELEATESKAPTEIIFKEKADIILRNSYCSGVKLRNFLTSLSVKSKCELKKDFIKIKYGDLKEGTFISDLVNIIDDSSNVQEVLEKSKLIDINTVSFLSMLLVEGLISIDNLTNTKAQYNSKTLLLKNKLEAYSFILTEVLNAFIANKVAFPVHELIELSESLEMDAGKVISFDHKGKIDELSLVSMIECCSKLSNLSSYYIHKLESIIQFLLQISGDNLDWEVAKDIRLKYQEISS